MSSSQGNHPTTPAGNRTDPQMMAFFETPQGKAVIAQYQASQSNLNPQDQNEAGSAPTSNRWSFDVSDGLRTSGFSGNARPPFESPSFGSQGLEFTSGSTFGSSSVYRGRPVPSFGDDDDDDLTVESSLRRQGGNPANDASRRNAETALTARNETISEVASLADQAKDDITYSETAKGRCNGEMEVKDQQAAAVHSEYESKCMAALAYRDKKIQAANIEFNEVCRKLENDRQAKLFPINRQKQIIQDQIVDLDSLLKVSRRDLKLHETSLKVHRRERDRLTSLLESLDN